MRRADRAVNDIQEIKHILDQCKTCHLAMVDDGHPYVVPLSYAYEMVGDTLVLYFHSAKEGRKIDILHKNSEVCFEICHEGELAFSEKAPCSSGYYFSCVHGVGNVEFIDDASEACDALSRLMKHQANLVVQFTKEQAECVCLYKVVVDEFVGKRK